MKSREIIEKLDGISWIVAGFIFLFCIDASHVYGFFNILLFLAAFAFGLMFCTPMGIVYLITRALESITVTAKKD